MTFEIDKHKCELCKEQAKVAMNDKDNRLHYSCEKHVVKLWDKLGKP